MAKRTVAQTGVAAKRAKLDPMVVGVMEAIEKAQINEACKSMLQAGCPLSLGLPVNKRHSAQKEVIHMIGEVLAGSAYELESAVRAQQSRTMQLEAKKGELTIALQERASELKIRAEAVSAARQEVEAASLAAEAADETFRQRLEVQDQGDKEAKTLKDEKDRLETAVKQHLEPVQQADLEESAAQKHAQALQGLAQSLALDEALMASLPKACTRAKSCRGAFDIMVLDTLAETLRTQLVSIDERMETEAPGVVARAEAVAEASRAIEVNAEAKTRHAAALEVAIAAETEFQSQLQEAETAVLMVEVEIEKAVRDAASATAALDEFKAWPLECFSMLKDKASVAEVGGA